MGQFVDLTGQRFGRWVVLYRGADVEEKGHPRVRWHCRCDCGVERDVAPNSLKNGTSRSCGCLHTDVVIEMGSPNKTHGMTGTRLHRIWKNIRTRCNNPKNGKYARHGGRGISVCEEWSGKDGFANFYRWAMDSGYGDDLTIDRIDNDGNYCPGNCRWVSNRVQSNNKSTCRKIAVDGKEMTISEWVDYLGVSRWKLYYHSDEETEAIIRGLLPGKL